MPGGVQRQRRQEGIAGGKAGGGTGRDARDPSAGSGHALGHGQGYVYPHEQPGHHVGQQYLPTALLGTHFYSPSAEGYEAQVKERLARWRAAQEQVLGLEQTDTLPELSESEVLDIKRRITRRGEND